MWKLVLINPPPTRPADGLAASMEDEMSNRAPRNLAGYVDTTNCYRTINGERYVGWSVTFSDAEVKSYRAAGIRYRIINGDELFVRETDLPAVAAMDRARERRT